MHSKKDKITGAETRSGLGVLWLQRDRWECFTMMKMSCVLILVVVIAYILI